MKNKRICRLLALVLALISVLSLVPAMAAEEWTTEYAVVDGELNSKIVYGGTWQVAKTDGVIDRARTTDEANGTATISFSGTQLRVYAEINNQDGDDDGVVDQWHNNDNVLIAIDGGTPVKMNLVSTTHIYDVDYMAYESEVLAAGEHTAVIYNMVHTGNPSNSGMFTLHSVAIKGDYISWENFNTVVDNEISDMFLFNGAWNISDPISNTGKTVKTTIDENTVSFDFYGNGLRIYAEVNNQDSNNDGVVDQWHNNNNVVVSIDGGEPQALNLTSETHIVKSDVLVYEVTGLSLDAHNVVITTKLQIAPVGSGAFALHSVGIANGELIKWDFTPAVKNGTANSDYLNFSGIWTVNADKTHNQTSIDGQTVDFGFTGTGLRVYAEINNQSSSGAGGTVNQWHNNNEVYISVDGGTPVKMDLIRETHTYDKGAIVYQIAGLTNTYHTAIITTKEPTAPVTSGLFSLYGIGVLEGNVKKWVNQPVLDGSAINSAYYEAAGIWTVGSEFEGLETSYPENSISAKFNGTGIRVYAAINNQSSTGGDTVDLWYNNNEVYITIDNGTPVKMNMTSSTPLIKEDALVYEITGLTLGEHTLVITTKEPTAPVESTFFCLNSISVTDGAMIDRGGYDVTVTVGSGGYASESSKTVYAGESFEVFFTPYANFKIADVKVNGVSQGAVESLAFDSVNEDLNIQVIFAADGIADGWNEIDGLWFYYENGVPRVDSWLKDDGKWYYLDENGIMATNVWKKDSKGWCYLSSNGTMAANKWIRDTKGWCYVGSNGYCVTNKWMKDSKGWCYLDNSGRMAVNKWVKDSKGWCFVGSNGYCVTSTWKKDSKGWCYLDKDGRMVISDWVKDGGKWYYLNSSGYMVTGTVKIDGKTYKFNSSGVLVG